MPMFWTSSILFPSKSPIFSLNEQFAEVTISGLDTEVGGKGSQLSGGQKRAQPMIFGFSPRYLLPN
jgi:hypothetical protein